MSEINSGSNESPKNQKKGFNLPKHALMGALAAATLGSGAMAPKAEAQSIHLTNIAAESPSIDWSQTHSLSGTNRIEKGPVTFNSTEIGTLHGYGYVRKGGANGGGFFREQGTTNIVIKVDNDAIDGLPKTTKNFICEMDIDGQVTVDRFDSIEDACRRANQCFERSSQNNQTRQAPRERYGI